MKLLQLLANALKNTSGWFIFSGFFIFAATLLTNKLLDLVLGDIYSSMLLLVSIFLVNL